MIPALAAGMMVSASLGLLYEGMSMPADGFRWLPAWSRAVVGAAAGAAFIVATQRCLSAYDDLKFSGFHGANAKKMLLIMAVMTLHSFTEGVCLACLLLVLTCFAQRLRCALARCCLQVGIGVAFAGDSGAHFGVFISTTLAIHNVPEGLAVRELALVAPAVAVPALLTRVAAVCDL